MKKVVYMFLMGFLLFSPIMSYAEEIDKEEQEKVKNRGRNPLK